MTGPNNIRFNFASKGSVLWIRIRIRIRIDLAVLDPDPYGEYRIRILEHGNGPKLINKPGYLPF